MAKTRIEQAPGRRKRGRLLTVDEVAERLGVEVTYVCRRLMFERLPDIRLGKKV